MTVYCLLIQIVMTISFIDVIVIVIIGSFHSKTVILEVIDSVMFISILYSVITIMVIIVIVNLTIIHSFIIPPISQATTTRTSPRLHLTFRSYFVQTYA